MEILVAIIAIACLPAALCVVMNTVLGTAAVAVVALTPAKRPTTVKCLTCKKDQSDYRHGLPKANPMGHSYTGL